MESGPSSVIGVSRVTQATSRDPLLARVVEFVQRGSPMNCPNKDICQYLIHRDKLTVQDGVLLWGPRRIAATAAIGSSRAAARITSGMHTLQTAPSKLRVVARHRRRHRTRRGLANRVQNNVEKSTLRW